MIKKMFFFAFICVLAGCQKDTVRFDSNELVSSYGYFPSDVNDMIANGGGHLGCETSSNIEFKNRDGALGKYEYPLTPDMTPLFLLHSSLPCQPNIPYFLFNFVHPEDGKYAATFFLVANPNYSSQVKVFDIDWTLNGQNNPVPLKTFTIHDLQIGESNSVTCKVFATDNKVAVYSQEMTFDFEVLLDLKTGVVIEYGSGYSYACTNTGLTPIIAP